MLPATSLIVSREGREGRGDGIAVRPFLPRILTIERLSERACETSLNWCSDGQEMTSWSTVRGYNIRGSLFSGIRVVYSTLKELIIFEKVAKHAHLPPEIEYMPRHGGTDQPYMHHMVA